MSQVILPLQRVFTASDVVAALKKAVPAVAKSIHDDGGWLEVGVVRPCPSPVREVGSLLNQNIRTCSWTAGGNQLLQGGDAADFEGQAAARRPEEPGGRAEGGGGVRRDGERARADHVQGDEGLGRAAIWCRA